jgi:iron complex transport system permease protein
VTATAPARPAGEGAGHGHGNGNGSGHGPGPGDDPLAPLANEARGPGARHTWVSVAVAAVLMVVIAMVALCVGPVAVPPSQVLGTLLAHVPLLHFHTSTPAINQAIVWQLRAPRVVLAGLVGAMLASGGAAYQGLFRNPLADPYLLGVAAGAGLGATIEIVYGGDSSSLLPVFAFVGGALAVGATYFIGVSGGRRAWGYSILLAGVAVAALLTAIQTYLQQRDAQQIRQIYDWILGSFSVASWSDVTLILPYVVVSGLVLLAHRRMLDVLRVGEEEAGTLGIHPARTRLIVVAAATLGTAAAVSVSGLIGFVGIIVAHTVRLTTGASYRIIVPVSMVGGAAFLIGADLIARTILSPTEVPIGVVTACLGAPFFLAVLVSRRTGAGMGSGS